MAPALDSEGDRNTSPEREAWQAAMLDDATRALLARDAAAFLHQSLSTPCLNALSGASGLVLVDMQGREFLDFHGNSLHQVGHGHPRVLEAIRAQLEALPFCPRRYTCEPAVALAERLAALPPGGPWRVLLAPGGALAVGMALKLARAVTSRHKTISLWESFHGASLDAISVGGEAIFRHGAGPLMPGAEHAPPPDPRDCPLCDDACTMRCAGYIEYMLEKQGDVAAVIAETVRCSPAIPPPGWWRRVREACDRHGALLILDEIPIGLGRTGAWLACEHFGIEPDIVLLGKGLGGGVLPLAAMIARAEFNDVAREGALGHYTHEKNPVLCAAALATLDVIEEERLVERSRKLGDEALARLEALAARQPAVRSARGLGLLLGVELGDHAGLPAAQLAIRAMHAALSRGLSFKISQGCILTLTPPLTIPEEDLWRALRIVESSIVEACNP